MPFRFIPLSAFVPLCLRAFLWTSERMHGPANARETPHLFVPTSVAPPGPPFPEPRPPPVVSLDRITPDADPCPSTSDHHESPIATKKGTQQLCCPHPNTPALRASVPYSKPQSSSEKFHYFVRKEFDMPVFASASPLLRPHRCDSLVTRDSVPGYLNARAVFTLVSRLIPHKKSPCLVRLPHRLTLHRNSQFFHSFFSGVENATAT